MDVGKQIKKFRQDLKLSQEELASKIFVTRQTISNWENGKNYPDVNSLVMLSQLFNTSLDILVKGDVIEMEKQVEQDDVRRFKRDTVIFTVLIILTVVSAVPLFLYLELSGIVLWLLIAGVMIYYAMQTVITILIVFAMVLLGIRTIKNYGIKSKNSASMFIGFIIGSLVGYYFLNSVICAFVGMVLCTGYAEKALKN